MKVLIAIFLQKTRWYKTIGLLMIIIIELDYIGYCVIYNLVR